MSQLWRKVFDITLPCYVQHYGSDDRVISKIVTQSLKTTAFVRWPNGKPCSAVNMYLLDESQKWTGDTAHHESSKLSHLIRYCYTSGKAFDELKDSDFYALSSVLLNEDLIYESGRKVRNSNTVRHILQSIIRFLFWYQNNLHCGSSDFIGDKNQPCQIRCSKRTSKHHSASYWYHSSFPEPVNTEPKLPIAYEMIESIEEQIEILYEEDAYCEKSRRRFGIRENELNTDSEKIFNSYRLYITSRRDFMLWMMRYTGCRPSEMISLSVKENYHSTSQEKPYLLIPTMKRRRLEPPTRKFPLSSSAALEVRTYLTARKKWIEACMHYNKNYEEPNAMFLSTEQGAFGKAISKSALEKDFKNLCRRAGYIEQQSCFSMFRHLFCTEQVQLHLRLWQDSNGPIQQKDYRTLLEKVREKTGHGNWESLLIYIDYTNQLNGAWSPVERALKRLEASNTLRSQLRQIRRNLQIARGDKLSATEVVDLIDSKLSQIISAASLDGLQKKEN